MSTIRYSLCIVFALVGLDATAGVITNGDFSSGNPLEGFLPTGNVTEPAPGDFAQFDNVGSLTQAFNIPSSASSLSFDFAFSTSDPSGTGTGLDSFAAELTTSPDIDVLDIFVVDESGVVKAPSNILATTSPPGFVAIDVANDPTVGIPGFQGVAGGTKFFSGRISLSLPSEVLGESATITFRLVDQDPGVQSLAALDNVVVTTNDSVIPEPTSFVLWLSATLLLLVGNPRRRKAFVSA